MKKLITLLTLAGMTCFAAQQVTDLTLVTPTISNKVTVLDQSDATGNELYVTNGVIWQKNSSRTNLITTQVCELSFVESGTQSFTGGGGYQIITNLVVNYTDGACITATTTGMVVGVSGYYIVEHGISLESTSGAAVLECDLFVNESGKDDGAGQEVHWKEQFTVTASTAFKGFSRIVHLESGDFVSLRIDPSASTESVSWFSGNLRLELIRK